MSRIGLGLAALGRPAYINLGHAEDLGPRRDVDTLQQRTHEVLDAAYRAGVRYFDAARSYGKAEAFLASWLGRSRIEPGAVTVGSKWGYQYTGGWRVDADVHEVKELSASMLLRQWHESVDLLGSHLSLYQIHSATLDSGVFDDAEVLDELARLRAGGVSIGFTVTGPKQREAIERALEVGGFDSVQATWNLLERSAGGALAAAHEAGLTVIVKEGVANGRLTDRGHVPLLAEAAHGAGVRPDALALAAVLAQPWADVVLSGASTPAMLASNLAAADIALGAGDELWERLRALREEPDPYWETRAGLPWN